MPGSLTGKVALVTGAASGIGAASAKALAAEGATVLLADLQDASDAAASIGASAKGVHLDVTDVDAWAELVARIEDTHRRLDALVNAAAIMEYGDLETLDMDSFRRVQRVNVEGTLIGCRACAPLLAKDGGGAIVNFSSTLAEVGVPPFLAYSASKAAILSLTRTLAVEFRQKNTPVRCNSIMPGRILTPMLQESERLAGHDIAGEAPDSPLLRELNIGQPADVAAMVVFLASDASRFVNGAALRVDNALSAGG